ncbi:leucine carboxyl methyltransferase [Chitinophaga skermanii]|uniref:Leucine carboxyl methyltransferase n=1 Tax=Chitinophaga skermanii TaxID=331697 RepID=A0A327QKD2_9BACT|nr:class I SAM-dependent methyltransferase [Chitinophaga skermanii]RAJ04164.1 leucine carboxyl methyltransferase [Chitinophaga skermanii]
MLANKIKVAPTSALVLKHAQQLYDQGLAHQYLQFLDFEHLGEGIDAFDEHAKILGDVLYFRKLFTRFLIDRYLWEDGQMQVVILAAGLDPLALYLFEHHHAAISQIFEVDASFTEEKNAIYKKLLPAHASIQLLQADLREPQVLLDTLTKHGYDSSIPTLLVFEGIIHYINGNTFHRLMERFRSSQKHNVVVMDYALPIHQVPLPHRERVEAILQKLETLVQGNLSMYSRENVFALIDALHGDIATIDSIADVEFKLKARNELFHQVGEGWIEMISFYL